MAAQTANALLRDAVSHWRPKLEHKEQIKLDEVKAWLSDFVTKASRIVRYGMTGDDLKKLRTKAGLTQTELAEKLKLNYVTILHYEKGNRPIPMQVESAIHAVFRELSGKRGAA